MEIAVALFDQVTALDAIGPYEVLQRLPDAEVRFVGHRRGEVRTDNGFLGLAVDRTFDEVSSPDILVVPGGIGAKPSEDRVVIEGKVITAAGVSSGIDMALHLAERLTDATTSKALQLMIEYDPQPPHDAGALHKVDAVVLSRVRELAKLRN